MGYLTKLVNTSSIVPNVVDTRKYTIIKIDHDKSFCSFVWYDAGIWKTGFKISVLWSVMFGVM